MTDRDPKSERMIALLEDFTTRGFLQQESMEELEELLEQADEDQLEVLSTLAADSKTDSMWALSLHELEGFGRPVDSGGWDHADESNAEPETIQLSGAVSLLESSEGSARAHLRYEDRGLLGRGGMAEVRRVHDRLLGRQAAMKILQLQLQDDELMRARFLEEAQASSQLQHPGIVPIYDMGRLEDGRPYFTMREIRGRTLRSVIREVHRASDQIGGWSITRDGWSLRRMLAAMRRVCEAVAYANDRGVIHRDLKPGNIMIGDAGEVLVVDWGVAKILALGEPDRTPSDAGPRSDTSSEERGDRDLTLEASAEHRAMQPTRQQPALRQVGATEPGLPARQGEGASTQDRVITAQSRSNISLTEYGSVTGTPNYMPPEQARGEHDAIDARSDVYALGATLYEVLCGRSPYVGAHALEVLLRVLRGAPPPAQLRTNLPLPRQLLECCARAMARDPDDRFASAAELGEELGAWLEGLRQREAAQQEIEKAEELFARADDLELQGRALAEEAASTLASLTHWASQQDKREAWTLDDRARAKRAEASQVRGEGELLLWRALSFAPHLDHPHRLLLQLRAEDHREAEAARDRIAQLRAEQMMREHMAHLPERDAQRIAHHRYLEGVGLLSLEVTAPQARITIARYNEIDRKLVAEAISAPLDAPLRSHKLPIGSYLLEVHAPGHHSARYPVSIERLGHWDCVPPEATRPRPLELMEQGTLHDDERYVPAGWTWIGGDPQARGSLEGQQLWVEGFVIKRHPVSNGEYIAFLNDLLRQGRRDEALRHAPRDRNSPVGDHRTIIYGQHEDGSFYLKPDADGDLWEPDWPVIMIDWQGARAYAEWMAVRRGLPYRLPFEFEWEKAARGVDRRAYPWGDFFDPSRCCTRNSFEVPHPARLEQFPADTSPYDVRHLAGNVYEWCADRYTADPLDGPLMPRLLGDPDQTRDRVNRGGGWDMDGQKARAAGRVYFPSSSQYFNLGFRIARSWPPEAT